MTVIFTDTEIEWIDKKPFNWTVKKGCPDKIKKSLLKKLELLKIPQGEVKKHGKS